MINVRDYPLATEIALKESHLPSKDVEVESTARTSVPEFVDHTYN